MSEENSLYNYFRPFLKRFLLALGFMAMVAAFTAFFAVIIQPVIDELFIQGGGKLAEKSQFIRNLIMRILNVQEKQLVLVLPQLLFVAFLGQAIFYILGVLPGSPKLRLSGTIRAFLLLNLTALMALPVFLTGRQRVVWK